MCVATHDPDEHDDEDAYGDALHRYNPIDRPVSFAAGSRESRRACCRVDADSRQHGGHELRPGARRLGLGGPSRRRVELLGLAHSGVWLVLAEQRRGLERRTAEDVEEVGAGGRRGGADAGDGGPAAGERTRVEVDVQLARVLQQAVRCGARS